MGLFDFGKKSQAPVSTPTPNTPAPSAAPSMGILNLSKDSILDLSKDVEASLRSMRVSAGWDVNDRGGSSYDLDLCAFLLDERNKLVGKINPVVYYGDKKSTGIRLDGDNLTGEGDGDDENIFVQLENVPDYVHSIRFYVVIYNARSKGQCFKNVHNAYVRLVNTENRPEKEVCRYPLSTNGGSNTAVYFCELFRNNGSWNFHTVGDYLCASIDDIKRQLR